MAVYQSGHILSVTSGSEPLPRGQMITYAIMEYDRPVSSASLTPDSFAVQGRTITRVYANREPQKIETGRDGVYVILELSPKDADAPLVFRENAYGRVNDELPPKGGVPPEEFPVIAENRLEIRQCGDITAANGCVLPAVNERIASSKVENLIADEFETFFFEDISCNLYIPKGDPDVSLPLVLFIPDASVLGSDPRLALYQGNGATAFASKRDQSLHPCYVLAPSFLPSDKIKSDDGLEKATPLCEKIVRLLDYVCAAYHIDTSRIYATGQSFGCIAACALNILYPEKFAASLLVAGQWDAGQMSTLYQKPLWLAVSDGDERAYPSMTAILRELTEKGANTKTYHWNAKVSLEELSRLAGEAAEDSSLIHLCVFDDQSVVPEDETPSPISNHHNTWPVTYSIPELRDWLFTKSL